MRNNNTRQLFCKLSGRMIAIAAVSLSLIPVHAEEVQNAWDEEIRVHVLRRRVATAINVYTDGVSQDITHEEGVLDDVIYDILRVNPTEHTRIQVDYTGMPGYVNELKDEETLAKGYKYAGGINAGYFASDGEGYGRPVGAVRRNNAWCEWNWETLTPAYGNGFATAYITGNELELKYHGWGGGHWYGDSSWRWWTGYTLNADYGVSGSFTYFADGAEQDITKGQNGGIDYRTYGRAVTILAQKPDKQFLLITLYGTVEEAHIADFLRQLGVEDAIRMDGGGSTQMVYDTDLVRNVEPEIAGTAITEVEEPAENPIGYVTVNVDKLRMRRDHRTSSASLGYATNGERYQVYEIYDDSDYTWYRIGSRRWIAGNAKWTSYEEIALIEPPVAEPEAEAAAVPEESAAPADPEETAGTMEVTVVVDNLHIRNGAGLSRAIIGKAENGKTYTAYETAQAEGYTWYRIGEGQWIAGNPDWITVK